MEERLTAIPSVLINPAIGRDAERQWGETDDAVKCFHLAIEVKIQTHCAPTVYLLKLHQWESGLNDGQN